MREAVGEALVQTEQTFTQRRAEIYANLAQLLAYRPSQPAPDAYLEMSSAAGSLMTGLVVRVISNPSWLDEREALALYGASRQADWSHAGAARRRPAAVTARARPARRLDR